MCFVCFSSHLYSYVFLKHKQVFLDHIKVFRPLKHILSVFVFRKLHYSSYFLGSQFIINIYTHIGLNLFKCIHKITNVKIILFLNKNTKKIFKDSSHQLSVALLSIKHLNTCLFLSIIINYAKMLKTS